MTSSTPMQGVTTVYRTRSILGPLTTVFNAPPECALAGVAGTPLSIGFRGQTCVGDSLADESVCWPAATAAAPAASTPLNGWGFYSPGISCPAGYTTACDATQGYRTGWQMQFTMEEGETAVGCCPTYVMATSSFSRCHALNSNDYMCIFIVAILVRGSQMVRLASQPPQRWFRQPVVLRATLSRQTSPRFPSSTQAPTLRTHLRVPYRDSPLPHP